MCHFIHTHTHEACNYFVEKLEREIERVIKTTLILHTHIFLIVQINILLAFFFWPKVGGFFVWFFCLFVCKIIRFCPHSQGNCLTYVTQQILRILRTNTHQILSSYLHTMVEVSFSSFIDKQTNKTTTEDSIRTAGTSIENEEQKQMHVKKLRDQNDSHIDVPPPPIPCGRCV